MEKITNEEKAREYLLKEHLSPLNNILHQCDLKTELQYHKDIETAFIKGAEWKDEQHEQEKQQWIDKACKWWEREFLYPTMAQEEIDFYQTKIAEFKKSNGIK